MVLRVAAGVELASLIVLLVNLVTVHVDGVASLMGPVHGCAYLVVIGAAGSWRNRLLAAVPAVGGILVLRRVS